MRSSKKPNARQLTSTLMAIVMTATTTFQMPNIALASEAESSVAVESQIEEVTTKEASSVEVQSETVTQAAAETQTGTALETSSAAAGTDATQVSDEVRTTVAETTAEVTYEEEENTTLSAEVDPSGEDTEESEANETRGPDEELTTEIETEIETEAQTDAASEEETEASTEEALIDLSTATKDEILAYIEAIGGTESDAYYEFLGGLGEDDYQLVWIAQFGSEEDVIASTFDFDYDASSDLEIAKYVHKLTEDELYNLIESMTFEQYRRYLSIKEMMAEMDEKDFAEALPIFRLIYDSGTDTDAQKEAACVLAHAYRIAGDTNRFFQMTLRDMLSTPCAEICLELGAYFEEAEDYEEASLWYYNAAHETSSILDVHTGGDLPLQGLIRCYEIMLAALPEDDPFAALTANQYEEALADAREALANWDVPEEL